jgi:glycerophosphoryl diester phosphodiesterase
VALGVAVLILISIGGYFVLRGVDGDDDAIIIAHRGGAAVAPENTIAAFERGIADGADWLELDVQENAQGEIVVIHDRDFMRVAKSPLMVHEATSGELATIDIGSYFAPEFAAQRTPLLKDVLQAAKGKAGVVIELKYYGHEKELERRVVEIVDETGSQDNIVVMSMNYEGIRAMAALKPEWTYGFLNAVTIGDLTNLEVDFLAITAGAATRRMIQRAHARGLKVYVWTVDDPIQMTMMMSRGVDGIITDQVARTHDVRAWRASLTSIGRVVVWLAAEAGMLGDVDFSSDRDDA